MREAKKIWHSTAVTVLILGTLFSFYTLYQLPAELERSSTNIDLSVIKEASTTIYHLYFVVGFTLLFAMGISLWLLYSLGVHKNQAFEPQGEKEAKVKDPPKESTKQLHIKETLDDAVKEIWISAKDLNQAELRDQQLLSSLCMKIEASQGLLYKVKREKRKSFVELSSAFALSIPREEIAAYDLGEGLIGQVAKTGKKMSIEDIPEGYIKITSGLGAASPKNLVIIPIITRKKVIAVVEVASFRSISSFDEKLIAETFTLLKQEVNESDATINKGRLKESKYTN